MILAVLDDLMFSSKIRSTATRLGLTVSFARTPQAALAALDVAAQSEADPLTLVVLDLDNTGIDVLAIVTRLRSAPGLQSVPSLGFVSHVHTARIEAAREAGVTQIVARSAFAQQLPQLLSSGIR